MYLYKLNKFNLKRSVIYPQLVSSILDGTCKLAIPKSAILIFKFLSNNKFSGFKSR